METRLFETERMNVNDLCENNYESIAKIYTNHVENAYATGVFRDSTQEEIKEKIYAVGENARAYFFVAESRENKETIGFCKAAYHAEWQAVWLHTFIIVSKIRREGYGKEFLEGICAYLMAQLPIKSISFSVAEENFVAKEFWKSNAFEEKQAVQNDDSEPGKTGFSNVFTKEI